MSFEALSDYLSNLRESEQVELESLLGKKAQDESLGKEIRGRLGMKPLVEKLLDILRQAVLKHACDWASALSIEKQACESQLQVTRRALSDYDRDNMFVELRKYVHEYVQVLIHLRKGTTHYVTLNAPACEHPFAPQEVVSVSLDNHPCTTTWEMETQKCPALAKPYRDGGKGKSLPELKQELDREYLGTLLDCELGPDAAYARALMVAKYLIMDYPFTDQTIDQIVTLAGRGHSGAIGHLPKAHVFKTILTKQILELQTLVSGLADHIKWLYTETCPATHRSLQAIFPVLANVKAFTSTLDGWYRCLLHEQIKKACDLVFQLFKAKTEFLKVDLSVTLISLLGSTPFREDILKRDPVPYEEEMRNELDSSDSSKLAPVPVKSRSCDRQAAARVQEQRQAVLALKADLHAKRAGFRPIDFVEGGLQDLHTEDFKDFNEEEINRDCKVYWYILKGLLVMDLEALFDAQVLKALDDEVPLSLRLKLEDWISKLSTDEILDMVDQEGLTAQKRREHDEQQAKVRVLSDALDKVLTVLGGSWVPLPPRAPQSQGAQKSLPLEEHDEAVPVPLGSMVLGNMDPKNLRAFQDVLRKDIAKALKVKLQDVKVMLQEQGAMYAVTGGGGHAEPAA